MELLEKSIRTGLERTSNKTSKVLCFLQYINVSLVVPYKTELAESRWEPTSVQATILATSSYTQERTFCSARIRQGTDLLTELYITELLQGLLEAWFRRKELDSAAAVGRCCMHNASLHGLLGFLFRKGNAEALDRLGGKAKHHLIAHFLSNTSAQNYRNRIVYVKIIVSRRWDVFLRNSVMHVSIIRKYRISATHKPDNSEYL